MLNAPVVNHVYRLVRDLASRQEAERDPGDEESESSFDETRDRDISIPPENLRQKRLRRIHRVGHGKIKRPRKSTRSVVKGGAPRDVKQHQTQLVQKSRVDISLGGTDPFGTFNLPQDSTTDRALHHWANVFQKTRMPITPRQQWMNINMSDRTLLSVTIYCSTYHIYFVRGTRAPPSCAALKLNAIQNINKAMRKPGVVPNDYTMVAVAFMTLLECLGGEPTACFIHRKGLQLMVRSRGGVQNLGFDGAAERIVSWADTCCAILLRIKPNLEPSLIPDAGETPIPGFTIGDLETRLLGLTPLTDFVQKIIYIWMRLRYLTEFLTALARKTGTTIDECFFSDKIDFVERQAMSLLHSDDLAESSSVAFFTAFLNASLIYIYEELRECPKWNNISSCLSRRIYSGLQMVDLSSARSHCPEFLLWTLMLGRSGDPPLGGPSQPWFLREIACVEHSLDVDVPNTITGLTYFELAEKTTLRRAKVDDVE